MTNTRGTNDRGMILFVALTILSLLMAVGVGVVVSTQSDLKVTANLRAATESFYIAEAGIAWAKEQLSRAAMNPPLPSPRTQSFASGSFSVSFLSPNRLSPLAGRVVVRSLGSSRNSSYTIQARITKTYDLADGGVSLKGNGSRVSIDSNSFFISGLDHDPTNGQLIFSAVPRPGIAASGPSLVEQIRRALNSSERELIVGNDGRGGAIALSDSIPASIVPKIAAELCNAPNTVKQSISAAGVLSLAGLTWGSRAMPQLRCIEGLASPGDSVTLAGSSTGAGILVVRNADLVLTGGLRWEGLILVAGDDVAFRVTGNEKKEIYGSAIIHENQPALPSGRSTLELHGTVRVLYSRPALTRAAELIPISVLQAVYGSLPVMLTQDYWRALVP